MGGISTVEKATILFVLSRNKELNGTFQGPIGNRFSCLL